MRGRLQRGEVKDLIDSLDSSLASVGAMRDDLTKRLDQEQARSKLDEVALLTESTLRSKLERQRALFNTVVDQLRQAQFVSDFNSISAQAIEPPVALRKPVRPLVAITLALALFCGVVAGGAAAMVVDRLDPRIRSLAELRGFLDVSILGQIPEDRRPRGAANGDFGRICHDMPRSSYAEAFRAIRTNVDLLRRRLHFRVLLISSPHAGDGKSSVASNIAISLAHAGRKVLMIDADLRKPTQHRIHPVSGAVGLVQVLRDALPIARAAQPTAIENLDLVVAGPQTPNPAELLASPRLAEALTEARAAYDLVIIDSAPFLAVTDSTILGAMVDGVVLVVREDHIKQGEALAIRDLLNGLGTTLLGVLANRVSRGTGGYDYGYGADRDHTPAAAAVDAVLDRTDPGPLGPPDAWARSNGTAH
ncbi:MAG: capsular exopolysaccharide biosynthesis protein [Planctomycetota bacterium]|nr:capsular exopolysaccharide biosynthesis protein [Planctomycetota bacterium]